MTDDDRYRDLLELIGELRKQTQKMELVLYERLTVLLSTYREDVYRTTMGIHHRLLSYEDKLQEDTKVREARQKDLDARLDAIQHNQRLWIRVVTSVALIAVGFVLAYWIWIL